jgi:hypothetical protein
MYDIYGLGNALVDSEYLVDDGYLRSHGIDKGHMTLVDELRLRTLLSGLSSRPAKQIRDLAVRRSIRAKLPTITPEITFSTISNAPG